MKVHDKVSDAVTEAFEFDGQDEGGELRARLAASPSVPDGAEVVVGSWRLYLPQYTTLPDATSEVETEIVERYSWLVWDDEDGRWEIYPPKLYNKFFEPIPEEETDGGA